MDINQLLDTRHLELRHLKCFWAVAQAKHFGKAALKLNMDQAPLSRNIKSLEDSLGAKLFVRNAKSTFLTREGEILLTKVQDIFNIINDIKTKISASQNGYSGVFRIGINDGIDVTRISELIRVYRQNNPEIDIQMQDVSYESITSHLEYDCDVIFCRSRTHDKDIICEQIWIDEIVVLMHPKHPLSKNIEVSFLELSNFKIYSLNSDKYFGYCDQLKGHFDSLDIDVPYVLDYVSSYEQMLTLVTAGLGVGLIDYATFNNLLNRQVIIKRMSEKYYLKTYMVYNIAQKIDVFKQIISYARNFDVD